MFSTEGMIMEKQNCVGKGTPSALGMHRESQIISKARPKIRIIHIFAPEIIKTDVENFRELVQRLTGKPTAETKKKPRRMRRKEEAISSSSSSMRALASNRSKDTQSCRYRSLSSRIKGEAEIWGGGEGDHDHLNSGGGGGGGFLGGFADLDGFMQELNQFPLLPLDASFHMDASGETSQLA